MLLYDITNNIESITRLELNTDVGTESLTAVRYVLFHNPESITTLINVVKITKFITITHLIMNFFKS